MNHAVVDALIEIPLGSRNKYELDKATGRIRLDRVLYAAMIYPAEYGILENTLAPDGDALDILVICSDPTFPGCIVPARVLGYLDMMDGGKLDYKLISVVDCDPRYDSIRELEDLSPFVLKEIANFFANYKVLQGIQVEVGSYHSKEEAMVYYDKYAEMALNLMLRKNHDYNEAWRGMRTTSYTDLILTKIWRTKQIEELGGETKVSEGVDANYMDMINYAVFGLIKNGLAE